MNGKALEARSGAKTAGQIRLPFFYGWLLVGVSFVTMAIGVNARTAYSLLFPHILDEFGWDRGITAGAFSFGFLVLSRFVLEFDWRGLRSDEDTWSGSKVNRVIGEFLGQALPSVHFAHSDLT
jgi:hypothetical protein